MQVVSSGIKSSQSDDRSHPANGRTGDDNPTQTQTRCRSADAEIRKSKERRDDLPGFEEHLLRVDETSVLPGLESRNVGLDYRTNGAVHADVTAGGRIELSGSFGSRDHEIADATNEVMQATTDDDPAVIHIDECTAGDVPDGRMISDAVEPKHDVGPISMITEQLSSSLAVGVNEHNGPLQIVDNFTDQHVEHEVRPISMITEQMISSSLAVGVTEHNGPLQIVENFTDQHVVIAEIADRQSDHAVQVQSTHISAVDIPVKESASTTLGNSVSISDIKQILEKTYPADIDSVVADDDDDCSLKRRQRMAVDDSGRLLANGHSSDENHDLNASPEHIKKVIEKMERLPTDCFSDSDNTVTATENGNVTEIQDDIKLPTNCQPDALGCELDNGCAATRFDFIEQNVDADAQKVDTPVNGVGGATEYEINSDSMTSLGQHSSENEISERLTDGTACCQRNPDGEPNHVDVVPTEFQSIADPIDTACTSTERHVENAHTDDTVLSVHVDQQGNGVGDIVSDIVSDTERHFEDGSMADVGLNYIRGITTDPVSDGENCTMHSAVQQSDAGFVETVVITSDDNLQPSSDTRETLTETSIADRHYGNSEISAESCASLSKADSGLDCDAEVDTSHRIDTGKATSLRPASCSLHHTCVIDNTPSGEARLSCENSDNPLLRSSHLKQFPTSASSDRGVYPSDETLTHAESEFTARRRSARPHSAIVHRRLGAASVSRARSTVESSGTTGERRAAATDEPDPVLALRLTSSVVDVVCLLQRLVHAADNLTRTLCSAALCSRDPGENIESASTARSDLADVGHVPADGDVPDDGVKIVLTETTMKLRRRSISVSSPWFCFQLILSSEIK